MTRVFSLLLAGSLLVGPAWADDIEAEDFGEAVNTRLTESHADAEIKVLFESYEAYLMKTYPEWATYLGDHRYDDQLSDLSDLGYQAHLKALGQFLNHLKAISYEQLSETNQLNAKLFEKSLKDELSNAKFQWHYQPLGQQSGLHIDFPQLAQIQPMAQLQDMRNYLERLRGFEKQVSDVIYLMRQGLARGLVPPRFIAQQVLSQIEGIAQQSLTESPFFSPLRKLPPLEQEVAEAELKAVLQDVVFAGYQRLAQFVKTEYLPKCRDTTGVWALPAGKARYAAMIQNHVGLPLTAEEIHYMGLREVERLTQEMEQTKAQIGFKGSLDAFHQYLKTDPKFQFSSKAAMLKAYQATLSRSQSILPKLFGRLPQTPVGLKEIESYRAKSAPQAYYYAAPEDGSRPGYFYINTYDLTARPTYTMTALTLHEAVPGHHLQIALSQEQKSLPFFRRHMGVTAFVEGWGLYAESLGYATGMYQDLYQKYGALTFEMWRANRLVVDTGIHAKGWSREQAFQFMKKHTPNSDLDIRSEVDRYISWPGQALAYKMGELFIKRLRQEAEDELGSKFNIKAFHDELLKDGALPLPILEEKMESWLEAQVD